MKTVNEIRHILLICIIISFFIGCKKDPDKGKYYGTASATFNGKAWQSGKVRCIITKQCSYGKLGFQFQVYNQYNELREEMIFFKIPSAVGTYIINPLNLNDPLCKDTIPIGSYHTLQSDGDVALDSYNAILSSNNYFKIDNYNERTKELRGSFAVTFKIFSRQDPNSPDTIRVSNGSFNTKILE